MIAIPIAIEQKIKQPIKKVSIHKIILNIFFGPVINAARGIAYQISSSIYGFANNFQMAVNPQIIKSYAAGENEYMMNLIFQQKPLIYEKKVSFAYFL